MDIGDLPEAPIRLVATALDGTLLRSDSSVSGRSRALLARQSGNFS
jgi:hydroxymethylpyrimidine pyrophosphatase-like HAD family hydrolase